MSPVRRCRRAALAAGLAAAGALTACTHAGPPAGGPARPDTTHVTQSAPPSPPPVTASPTASAAPSAAPAQPAAAQGPPACATADLRVSVGTGNGTAGSIYYPVLFTNASAATCTMYGYPGVALVTTPGGKVVGAPAVRNPTFPRMVVTLAPGAVAHASLQVTIAANYPVARCEPATAHWLQVYPPGQYAASYVAFTAQTCTARVGDGSTLGIYVVRPGATGP
jgi:Protein of unknown function (DUF4232)